MSQETTARDLVPFSNGEFRLDVVSHPTDGFRVQAPGLARALGFREAFDLLRNIPDEEKGSEPVRTPGGDQRVGYVTEAGFYRTLGQRQAARIPNESVRAQVERFQSWVYREVLPSLRQRGGYEVDVPRSLPEALRAYAAEVEAHEQTKAQVIELQPRAESWDTLADTGADYSVREAAYILNRDPAISTGQQRLFRLLRAWKLIDSRDRPYANHSTHVTLRPRTRTSHTTQEEVPAKPQVRVTVAGLMYLYKRMGGTTPLNLDDRGPGAA